MQQCIYKILNTKNNKFYIGSTTNFIKRKSSHLCQLRINNHRNKFIQKDYNNFGEEVFIFSIVKFVKNKNDLISKESDYIKKLKPGYNKLVPRKKYTQSDINNVYMAINL